MEKGMCNIITLSQYSKKKYHIIFLLHISTIFSAY